MKVQDPQTWLGKTRGEQVMGIECAGRGDHWFTFQTRKHKDTGQVWRTRANTHQSKDNRAPPAQASRVQLEGSRLQCRMIQGHRVLSEHWCSIKSISWLCTMAWARLLLQVHPPESYWWAAEGWEGIPPLLSASWLLSPGSSCAPSLGPGAAEVEAHWCLSYAFSSL